MFRGVCRGVCVHMGVLFSPSWPAMATRVLPWLCTERLQAPGPGSPRRVVLGGSAALFLGNFGLAWRSPIGCQLPWKRGWHGSTEPGARAGWLQLSASKPPPDRRRRTGCERPPGSRGAEMGRAGAVPRRVSPPRGLSPGQGFAARMVAPEPVPVPRCGAQAEAVLLLPLPRVLGSGAGTYAVYQEPDWGSNPAAFPFPRVFP